MKIKKITIPRSPDLKLSKMRTVVKWEKITGKK
ncbi:MAG: hypothetical protein ACD_7C00533G0003 [uncultured bacterium]|nr:MAG: hypothetical protein ACD_7C00533G0003 [uncultured bacterium]